MARLSILIDYFRGHLSPGRLGRNVSQQMLQTIAETGSRTVTTFVVAAIFSAALFGELGVLLTLVHFLFTVADGSCAAMVKFTAEARTRRPRLGAELGWRGAWLSTAAATAGGAVIFAGAGLFGGHPDSATALTLGLAWALGVAWILKNSIEAAFRGLKDFGPPAIWAIAIAPIHSIVLVAAVWSGWRLTGYMAIMAAGVGVNAAALATHYHVRHRRAKSESGEKILSPAFANDLRASTAAMIRYARPLMLRGAIWFFFLKVNILIVALFQGDAETGFVTLADRFLLLPLLVIGAYVNAIAPRMAEVTALGDRARLQQYMSKSNTALTLAMIPFGVAFAAMGPVLARWMPDYEPVGLLLLAMAPFLVIKAWGGLAMSGALIPGGQARLALWIGVFGSAANLALNLWLVPQFGAFGSVMGMIAAHTLVTFAAIHFARRRLGVAFRFGGLK